MYLEYHKEKKQVVEIHENEPTLKDGYDYAESNNFNVGDEFEWTIWINKVDEDNNLTSYSAIRNNPNAKRLLEENVVLKQQTSTALMGIADVFEGKLVTDERLSSTMLALTEIYEELIALKNGGIE